ncbi:MAG: hypothetical protein KBH93_02610 [Anaerolineae bacterium]|nr:hypothetical protein [Anaerolineae bacterium]
MWLVAEYEASALFTLKPATATASGGKTLLVPTPFAIKMALLDVACRLEGQTAAAEAWKWLGGLTVALRPAPTVVVNNTFTKVLKPRRGETRPGSKHAGYFQQTINYREYAHLAGTFAIALQLSADADAERLARWLLHVNYLGKRGSFIQLQGVPEIVDVLPEDFIVVDGQLQGFDLGAVLTQLDDVGEGLSFERANIYSGEKITLGKHRVLRHVALPYRLVASSRGYSHYELVGETP